MREWLRTTSLVSKEPLQQTSNIICESRKSIPTKSGRECVNKRTWNFQECVTVFKMCEDFKLWKLKFVQKSPKKMCKSYKNQYHEIDVPKKRDIVYEHTVFDGRGWSSHPLHHTTKNLFNVSWCETIETDIHFEVQVTESFEELLANPWVLVTFIDCRLDQPRVEVVPWAKRSGRLLCHVSLDVECDVRVIPPLSSSIWHTLSYKSVALTQPVFESTFKVCMDSSTEYLTDMSGSVRTCFGNRCQEWCRSCTTCCTPLLYNLYNKFGLVYRHNTTFFLSKERMDSQ